MKAIYIGAGTDVTPIQSLKHIKDWIYIDCQPFSEFGIRVHECDNTTSSGPPPCRAFCNGFKRPRFIPQVKEEMERIGMIYRKISEDELEFTNETQRVTYFVNTSLPEHIDKVKERIKGFDNWICMGHDPDYEAIKYAAKHITFWGNNGTVYTKDGYYKNCLFYKIAEDEDIRKRFTSFNIIDKVNIVSYREWSEIFEYVRRRALQSWSQRRLPIITTPLLEPPSLNDQPKGE